MHDFSLYGGQVLGRFNPANHRYTISTDGQTWGYKMGVTTILGILNKPALMMWPLDEAMKYLFGQKFQESMQDDGNTIVEPVYSPSEAILRPDTSYTHEQLQEALKQARNAHSSKRDKGADIGSEVHQMIEDYLNKRVTIVPSKEAEKAFEGFKAWFTSQPLKVLKAERVVYSKKYDYCGTFDALIEINGKQVLCDWKTSNPSRTAPKGIYADNFIQLGAYALAYEEEFGECIDDLAVINVGKNGKVSTQRLSDLQYQPISMQNLFVNTLKLHRIKYDLDKKLKEIK